MPANIWENSLYIYFIAHQPLSSRPWGSHIVAHFVRVFVYSSLQYVKLSIEFEAKWWRKEKCWVEINENLSTPFQLLSQFRPTHWQICGRFVLVNCGRFEASQWNLINEENVDIFIQRFNDDRFSFSRWETSHERILKSTRLGNSANLTQDSRRKLKCHTA